MKIEVKDVYFGYSDDRMVLNSIDLTIEEPGLYCIVGPNGVGKSTLIKCINKIIKPTSGQVLIDGVDVTTMSYKDIADIIGYVPVRSMDVFSLPVTDAVLMGRSNKNRWRTKKEDLVLVNRALRMMGIEDLAMRNLNELSAGQYQKVAIAKGLVQEPKLLILDEPTANLDVKLQIYVTELLRALAEEEHMIVLMISHDLNIAVKYAHELIVMAPPGVIKAVGPARDVLTTDLVSEIYDVNCKIVEVDDIPLIVLDSVKSI